MDGYIPVPDGIKSPAISREEIDTSEPPVVVSLEMYLWNGISIREIGHYLEVIANGMKNSEDDGMYRDTMLEINGLAGDGERVTPMPAVLHVDSMNAQQREQFGRLIDEGLAMVDEYEKGQE